VNRKVRVARTGAGAVCLTTVCYPFARLGLALLSMPLSFWSAASPFPTCEPGVRVTSPAGAMLLAGTLGAQGFAMSPAKFDAVRFLDAAVRKAAEIELRNEISKAMMKGRLDILRLGPVAPPVALCIGR